MKIFNHMFAILLAIFLSSCNTGPKVISTPVASSSPTDQPSTGIFSDEANTNSSASLPTTNEVHTVKVLEVLPTSKYVYLKVDENGEEFWIATSKKEVKVGEQYFYKNGILKTNFESKEHNRVFDKVYLVANIVSADHGADQITTSTQSKTEIQTDTPPINQIEGSIKISEIVNNKSKYDGKEVQITGKCTKLNANIMGRNWIHLKDGSMDEFDLVITSDQPVPEGHVVTMKGIVILDKDFGSGYKYDLIIELGQIVTGKE